MSDRAVVGTAVTDAAGRARVSVASPLALGEVYGSQSEASSEPAAFTTPILHWGAPQQLASCAEMLPFDSGLGLIADVGSEIFAVSLEVSDPRRVELGTSYPALLVVGTPSQVVRCADAYVLASPTHVPTTLPFLTTGETGFVNVDLPIPDDPAYGGVQIAFQWWIVDGTEVRLSDVIGVVLRSQPFVPPGQEWFFGVASDRARTAGVQDIVPSDSSRSLTATRALALRWGARLAPSLVESLLAKLARE
jgi:hypothetical protein